MIASEDRVQIEVGVRHLHSLGARAMAELLIELTEPVGEIPLLIGMLQNYRRITPAMLRATGGDQFPRRFSIVEAA